MQAGKLNERITIEQFTLTKDASGGQQRGWVDVAKNIAASRRDFSGAEKPATAQAGGEVATARVEFTLHYRPDIDATMRVRHGSALFNIRGVNNFGGRYRSLVLTCDTGVNDG